MKYLITGGCGFLGTNLSAEVLKRKEELYILDNFYKVDSINNFNWLKSQGEFTFINIDIRNENNVEKIIKEIKPDTIFHLAAQVAMSTSLNNPKVDFEINVLGTLNLLEAVRKHSPQSIIIYSSTNKVYGDLSWLNYEEKEKKYIIIDFPQGFSETLPLHFHTPYGCSKGSADQYMLDYNRVFRLKTVVFRHSSIYGERQFSNDVQGWIGWFSKKALEIKKEMVKTLFTISGNGKQVRDILYIDDAVNLYFQSTMNIDKIKGKAFNIGGGIENSFSLLELFDFLEEELDIKMIYTCLEWRESDQKVFIADINKINRVLGWQPKISKFEGIKKMLEWEKKIL